MCYHILKSGATCKNKSTDNYCHLHRSEGKADRLFLENTRLCDKIAKLKDDIKNLTMSNTDSYKEIFDTLSETHEIIPHAYFKKITVDSKTGMAGLHMNLESTCGDRYTITRRSVFEKMSITNAILMEMDGPCKCDARVERKKFESREHDLKNKAEDHKNRYDKIKRLYEGSLSQITKLTGTIKEKDAIIQRSEVLINKCEESDNSNKILESYSVADKFIQTCIFEEKGIVRNAFNKCSIDDFINLNNIGSILNNLQMGKNEFINKFNTLRNIRVCIAHPEVKEKIKIRDVRTALCV